MLKSKGSQKGFTLVELLTVIAIIAIISTLSVVGYRNFTINTSKSMDKELVKQLNRAIESERLYGEKADTVIASVIQDLFGNKIEVQSLKYGYDIYYDANLYEFCLYEQRYSQQHKSIHYYLALKVENSDSDEGQDELIIDFANIPKEKDLTSKMIP